jgi:hypothetical protein
MYSGMIFSKVLSEFPDLGLDLKVLKPIMVYLLCEIIMTTGKTLKSSGFAGTLFL